MLAALRRAVLGFNCALQVIKLLAEFGMFFGEERNTYCPKRNDVGASR